MFKIFFLLVFCEDVTWSGTSTTYRLKKTTTLGRHYNPNYGYEPYWPGGDWVLYGDPTAPSTTPPPLVCGEECHELYRDISKVCGRFIDNTYYYEAYCPTWINWYRQCPPIYLARGYHTFNSYCEFLHKQCSSTKTIKPVINRWIFVHVGECHQVQNLTLKPMYTDEPVIRMKGYVSDLVDRFAKLNREPCAKHDTPSPKRPRTTKSAKPK